MDINIDFHGYLDVSLASKTIAITEVLYPFNHIDYHGLM
jgi:hypothetical protein